MKQLDLTILEDIIEFAENYHKYKNTIPLPKGVNLKIEKLIDDYNERMITSQDLNNSISETIINFMEFLDVKIKRK